MKRSHGVSGGPSLAALGIGVTASILIILVAVIRGQFPGWTLVYVPLVIATSIVYVSLRDRR